MKHAFLPLALSVFAQIASAQVVIDGRQLIRETTAPTGSPKSGWSTCWVDATTHVQTCVDSTGKSRVAMLPCSATVTTNCTPQLNSSGALLPGPLGPVNVGTAVTISTSGPASVGLTGFYFNNAAGALTFNLPTITTVGSQYCFRNYIGKSGAITLAAPASTYINVRGTNGSAAGTLVSNGALGDSACVVAVTTTQYVAYLGDGVWTNN